MTQDTATAAAPPAQDDFKSLPILDLSRLETDRAGFLDDWRHALVHVGFAYIVNHGIAQSLLDATNAKAIEFFDEPIESKLKVDKIHSPTFLGYSAQGNEITKNAKDNREQYDFANDLPDAWAPGKPQYLRLTGPNLWPEVPGFKDTISEFWQAAHDLAENLTELTAECLGLGPNGLDDYVVKGQQHRAKLIKVGGVGSFWTGVADAHSQYPAVDALAKEDGEQGVGPHRDTSNLLTLLYQANLGGLEVQNPSGEWIKAPPIPGSIIINIGTGLVSKEWGSWSAHCDRASKGKKNTNPELTALQEYIVQEVMTATTHKVTNPPPGAGPRYSIAYFHGKRFSFTL